MEDSGSDRRPFAGQPMDGLRSLSPGYQVLSSPTYSPRARDYSSRSPDVRGPTTQTNSPQGRGYWSGSPVYEGQPSPTYTPRAPNYSSRSPDVRGPTASTYSRQRRDSWSGSPVYEGQPSPTYSPRARDYSSGSRELQDPISPTYEDPPVKREAMDQPQTPPANHGDDHWRSFSARSPNNGNLIPKTEEPERSRSRSPMSPKSRQAIYEKNRREEEELRRHAERREAYERLIQCHKNDPTGRKNKLLDMPDPLEPYIPLSVLLSRPSPKRCNLPVRTRRPFKGSTPPKSKLGEQEENSDRPGCSSQPISLSKREPLQFRLETEERLLREREENSEAPGCSSQPISVDVPDPVVLPEWMYEAVRTPPSSPSLRSRDPPREDSESGRRPDPRQEDDHHRRPSHQESGWDHMEAQRRDHQTPADHGSRQRTRHYPKPSEDDSRRRAHHGPMSSSRSDHQSPAKHGSRQRTRHYRKPSEDDFRRRAHHGPMSSSRSDPVHREPSEDDSRRRAHHRQSESYRSDPNYRKPSEDDSRRRAHHRQSESSRRDRVHRKPYEHGSRQRTRHDPISSSRSDRNRARSPTVPQATSSSRRPVDAGNDRDRGAEMTIKQEQTTPPRIFIRENTFYDGEDSDATKISDSSDEEDLEKRWQNIRRHPLYQNGTAQQRFLIERYGGSVDFREPYPPRRESEATPRQRHDSGRHRRHHQDPQSSSSSQRHRRQDSPIRIKIRRKFIERMIEIVGANIERIHRDSGARCRLNDGTRVLKVWGTRDQMDSAARTVKECLKRFKEDDRRRRR